MQLSSKKQSYQQKDTMPLDKLQALKDTVYPVIGACQMVHKEMGAFLNEYMYQDALEIELKDRGLEFEKEFYFTAQFKGHTISHKHYADFMVRVAAQPILVECKAIDSLSDTQRQQLWNYMRLTGIKIGILYNFAPVIAQCEKWYIDGNKKTAF